MHNPPLVESSVAEKVENTSCGREEDTSKLLAPLCQTETALVSLLHINIRSTVKQNEADFLLTLITDEQ